MNTYRFAVSGRKEYMTEIDVEAETPEEAKRKCCEILQEDEFMNGTFSRVAWTGDNHEIYYGPLDVVEILGWKRIENG